MTHINDSWTTVKKLQLFIYMRRHAEDRFPPSYTMLIDIFDKNATNQFPDFFDFSPAIFSCMLEIVSVL